MNSSDIGVHWEQVRPLTTMTPSAVVIAFKGLGPNGADVRESVLVMEANDKPHFTHAADIRRGRSAAELN